ncbi:MAG TPA: response regulator [Bacteroidia bacterium]|nr:response regulator [Bacteroidia bacterium]
MSTLKILIVDDEQDVELLFRQRFRKELREGNFYFHFAFSAESALNFLKTLQPFDVVLVLSDINMPGMNGLELLKLIKTEFPELKVIMVTAYGDESNHSTAINYGADDFITKPVDFNLLKERIQVLNQTGFTN